MTDSARAKAFGVAAVITEILGWIALLGTSHVVVGLVLIVGGALLWGGVPAVADSRPARSVKNLGLQSIRDRVQSWDARENTGPDNNQMQRTGHGQTEPRR